MGEYMNKDLFLSSMGLTGDETKYGNRDAEHQHRSYSTYMSYEIVDCVEDSIAEDVVEVCRCRDCKWTDNVLSKNKVIWCDHDEQWVEEDNFCKYGSRRSE